MHFKSVKDIFIACLPRNALKQDQLQTTSDGQNSNWEITVVKIQSISFQRGDAGIFILLAAKFVLCFLLHAKCHSWNLHLKGDSISPLCRMPHHGFLLKVWDACDGAEAELGCRHKEMLVTKTPRRAGNVPQDSNHAQASGGLSRFHLHSLWIIRPCCLERSEVSSIPNTLVFGRKSFSWIMKRDCVHTRTAAERGRKDAPGRRNLCVHFEQLITMHRKSACICGCQNGLLTGGHMFRKSWEQCLARSQSQAATAFEMKNLPWSVSLYKSFGSVTPYQLLRSAGF